jgi:hypothetical protein
MFGLIFGAIGAVASIIGAGIQAKGASDTAEASKKAERLRLRQVNLESARQRRESYRQMLRARSQALLTAGAQGASTGYGQIGSKTAENISGINSAQEISKGIFKQNAAIADAQAMAAWGGGLTSLGQTVSSLKFGS